MEPVDFAIITALPEELEAVLSKLESYQLISTAFDTLPFYRANLGEAQIMVTRSGAGNIDATHAATTVLEQFKPRYVLMVGIAAGFQGKVNLGDVVVATACYYDGAGKETSAGKLPAPSQPPTSAFLLGRSRDYTVLDWKARIQQTSPAGDFQPSVHHGVIVSSETVVGDPARMADFLKVHRGVRALAMEGYGVAEAAHSHHIEFLEIRGICDFGDALKNDDWHKYAAHVAAAYTIGLVHYIESLPKTPRDRCGANYGISPEEYLRVAKELGVTSEKLGVTQKILDSFLETVGKKQVPLEKLDSTLTEIAQRYKELLEKVATFTSDDPEVQRLLTEAKAALKEGHFDEAEKLYNQASDRDVAAAKQLQELAEQRLVSAAQAKFANGKMKLTQLAYCEAAGYYQEAAKLLPAGHEEDRATFLNNAGFALHHAGEYQQALPLYQAALKIREQVLGQQHPDYATSLNNLAELYRTQGKYEQALPLYQAALKIREQVLGQQHPDYATSLNNLAELYRTQGKYEQALPLYQEALKIREQVLGHQHPYYATSLNNLALLYDSQGKYEQALPLYQEALKIREQVLGQHHPDYATSLNNLALLYDSQGQYEQALPLYQEALKIREQVLGHQHPDYASSLNNLAALYDSQGKYEQALPLLKEASKIWGQVLGKHHPDYALSLNNLAELYYYQEKYEEALPLHQEALKIREQVLGQHHPDYAQSLNNLAGLCYYQEKYEEALPLFQEALAIFTKALGEQHPNTQTVKQNYEACLNHNSPN